MDEITYVGWVEAWMCEQNPDLDFKDKSSWLEDIEYTVNKEITYCMARDMLYIRFMEIFAGYSIEYIKEILGLDICLK
jgi:hypothetical protein